MEMLDSSRVITGRNITPYTTRVIKLFEGSKGFPDGIEVVETVKVAVPGDAGRPFPHSGVTGIGPDDAERLRFEAAGKGHLYKTTKQKREILEAKQLHDTEVNHYGRAVTNLTPAEQLQKALAALEEPELKAAFLRAMADTIDGRKTAPTPKFPTVEEIEAAAEASISTGGLPEDGRLEDAGAAAPDEAMAAAVAGTDFGADLVDLNPGGGPE